MITRRKFIQLSAVTGAGLVLTSRGWLIRTAAGQTALLDAASHPKFVNPLPLPERIDTTDEKIVKKMQKGKGLKAEIKETKQKLGLFDAKGKELKTEVWGYKIKGADLTYPGATLVAYKDTPVLIKWENKLKEFDTRKLPPWQTHLLPVDTTTHLASPQNLPKAGIPVVTHLHGGHTESASDGVPEAWFTKKFDETGPTFVKETYRYDNDQEAATLWYHDHALGITRLNVYAGLAGFYLLRDDIENQLIADNVLPGGAYEKEIVIQDKMFSADGQLFFPSTNPEIEEINPLTGETFPALPDGPSIIAEFFGDFILVNGMAWPVLEVEPRKYRFRLLNGSDSRFYVLKFDNNQSFLQIGTDQGLLPQPMTINQLLLAPAERADLIIDFNALDNTELVLQNLGPDEPFKGMGVGAPANPATTGQIMKVKVSLPFDDSVSEASVDASTVLRDDITPPSQTGATRKLVLFEGLDDFGRLQPLLGTLGQGSLAWFEPISENPVLNDAEMWEIYNTTEDAHPIHIHLIRFLILNRESFTGTVQQRAQPQHNGTSGVGGILLADSVQLGGDARDPEPNERGWKDTVVALPGEVTRVITSPFDREGRYVWHCHIISHEDHEMMRPIQVG